MTTDLRSFAERHEVRAAWALALFGVALRAALFWRNPPGNAFDNHFEPIAKILATWQTPAKDACWECCQPPVFYWISAGWAALARRAGATDAQLFDVLHVLPLVFGIAWLGATWAILRRAALPAWARLAAFALACLLPRHLYMSALHGNDTLSYLTMALAMLAVMRLIDSGWSVRWGVTTTLAIVVAVFTKFTALALGPALALAWIVALRGGEPETRRRVLVVGATVLAVCGGFVLREFAQNHARYGQVVPEGPDILGVRLDQPPGDAIDFFDFRPWATIAEPLLTPRNVDSFWTQLHARAWFDVEPKFLYYSDPDDAWWGAYYRYLRGEAPNIPTPLVLSTTTRVVGGGLIALGLFVLPIMGLGLWRLLRPCHATADVARGGMSAVHWVFLLGLLLTNLAALVHYTARYPFYSHMKTSYVMGSWPVALLLIGVGLAAAGTRLRRATWIHLGLVAALVVAHVARIVTHG